MEAQEPTQTPVGTRDALSGLVMWMEMIEARVASLEGFAHSDHSIDEAAVETLANLIKQRLGTNRALA